MPGIIDKIFVNVGEEVQPGQSIAVIIAMKMEYVLKVSLVFVMFCFQFTYFPSISSFSQATVGGKVKSIAGKVGDNIKKGAKIVEIDQD